MGVGGARLRTFTPGTSLVVQWLRLWLTVQREWVQSLRGELRSHTPGDQKARNINNRSDNVAKSIKTLHKTKNIHPRREIRKPSSVINAKIEENNRMGKTRDLFKKIRDIKGTFHAKMGTIKDRNSKDLTEAEGIKKWQEYTEELYKKGFNDSGNHDSVVSHLE